MTNTEKTSLLISGVKSAKILEGIRDKLSEFADDLESLYGEDIKRITIHYEVEYEDDEGE